MEEVIDTVAERFNVEKNIASRLIMTESAAYHSKAKEKCLKDLGCEKYEVITTLDDRTSSVCRSMDSKVFDMKDYQVGVTAPPFHVYCRSVTAPYYDKIDGDTNLRASRTEDDDYKLVDVKYYQDWYDRYVEKHINNQVSLSNKNNIESKNKSDIIKLRNAKIDKEVKESVLKDVKHNSGLGTVGKKILKNIDLDENLEFVISNNRGSVKTSYDIEFTKSQKIMYRKKFEKMNLSLNDERNLYYREKTIFHESYHAMLNNKLVDVHFSDVDFIDKWRDIEEVFAESSGHYLSDLVGNKVKLGVSYPKRMCEILPRLKKFRKFKECETISDFGRIVYYERYKGKNAIWIPVREVIFKQELDTLEYSKQYMDYIEKNKSRIFVLIYKNAPDILSKEETREIIDKGTEIIKHTTSFNNLTGFEKEIFYNVLVSATKLKGVK